MNKVIKINIDYLAEDLAKQDLVEYIDFIGDDIYGYYDENNKLTDVGKKELEKYKNKRIKYLSQFEIL